MPITIVCPGCKKRFQVRDEFAGKSGPCPTCKTILKIPTKAEEVKIHAPDEFEGGGRGVSGKLALKPIAREEVRVKPVVAVAVGAAVLLVFAFAWFGQSWIQGSLSIRIVGLLLISPPLALAAYTFLRDGELEPFRGKELYLRAAACSGVYIVLWWLFGYMKDSFPPVEIWQWVFIAPPILFIGTMAGWLAFDLDPTSGFFHYSFYALATTLLGWVGGLGWIWEVIPPKP